MALVAKKPREGDLKLDESLAQAKPGCSRPGGAAATQWLGAMIRLTAPLPQGTHTFHVRPPAGWDP